MIGIRRERMMWGNATVVSTLVAVLCLMPNVAASQDTVTGFGDRSATCTTVQPGSELDQLYVRLGEAKATDPEPIERGVSEVMHRLERGENLHLADDLVAVGLVEKLTEGEQPLLQPVLGLGAHPSSLSGLLQRSSTLFG